MEKVKEFIKTSIRSFIKEQRIKAKLSPETQFLGYSLKEVEERAEQIPSCDLFHIIKYMDDGSFGEWWIKFQLQVYELKNTEARPL